MGNLQWKSQATLLDAWGKSSLSKFFRCCQSSDTSAGCSCGKLKFPTLSPLGFLPLLTESVVFTRKHLPSFILNRRTKEFRGKWGKATIRLLFIYFLFITTRSTKISQMNKRKQTKPQTTPLLYFYLFNRCYCKNYYCLQSSVIWNQYQSLSSESEFNLYQNLILREKKHRIL